MTEVQIKVDIANYFFKSTINMLTFFIREIVLFNKKKNNCIKRYDNKVDSKTSFL